MKHMMLYCEDCDRLWVHHLCNEIEAYASKINVTMKHDDPNIIYKVFNLETLFGGTMTDYSERHNNIFSKHYFPCPFCDKTIRLYFELIKV